MYKLNDPSAVRLQYANADKLNTRISIHDRYSVNKTGFGNWIFSHYRFPAGSRVLELGCGTGSMWKAQDALMDACSELVLSDLSEGMMTAAKENIGSRSNVSFRVIDIQDIPYEDGAFDAVIANMMLYHVPDLEKGLKEVRRVLKEGGSFYCATYGEHGIMEYLSVLLSDDGLKEKVNRSFTLQNGQRILGEFFSSVEKLEYPDALEVTNMDDMADYICSLSVMTDQNRLQRQEIKELLIKNAVNGVLHVPKEYGMFIAL